MRNYTANFTKASLILQESRIIAKLLLESPSEEVWREEVLIINILKKRTLNSSLGYANLVKARLGKLHPDALPLVAFGSREVATQMLLASTVKYSPLLGIFMLQVLQDLYRSFNDRLTIHHWDRFLEQVWEQQSPDASRWSERTILNLRRTGYRILVEAGFLSDTKLLKLQRVFIHPDVESFLKQHDEKFALACLRVSS
ncbi:DUF1819 family protein [Candidatus Magnetaquicoccus inordinatus]|uniref:DUF1819 family protein n=1 Tax=Candidatus Magnetaquicoccus inordinatus TaxID=2496818 RepID=UPI00102CF90C|nr:DUF1819 family protein [Candidatus Magnetaquicoccus inordinatus]